MLLTNSVAPDQTARMCRLIWGCTSLKPDNGHFLINWFICSTLYVKMSYSFIDISKQLRSVSEKITYIKHYMWLNTSKRET